MTSSQQTRFKLCVVPRGLANPTGGREADFLLDTSQWTGEDWEAATFLAGQLTLRNAAKRTGGGANNQGYIESMSHRLPHYVHNSQLSS